MFQLLVGWQRVAKLEDPLVGRDQIDGGLSAASLRFPPQQRRNLKLGLAGTHRESCVLYGIGAETAEYAKALAFLGQQVHSHAG